MTYFALRLCLAVIKSSSLLPLPRSFLPSIVSNCVAFLTSNTCMFPSNVATATSLPLGLYTTNKPSAVNSIVSCAEPFSSASHSRRVLSQLTEASAVLDALGLNARLHTGPSWPDRISSKRPSLRDQRKISNMSCPPAAMNSPLLSTATQASCTGRGDVKVRKLRYLKKLSFCPIVINNISINRKNTYNYAIWMLYDI